MYSERDSIISRPHRGTSPKCHSVLVMQQISVRSAVESEKSYIFKGWQFLKVFQKSSRYITIWKHWDKKWQWKLNSLKTFPKSFSIFEKIIKMGSHRDKICQNCQNCPADPVTEIYRWILSQKSKLWWMSLTYGTLNCEDKRCTSYCVLTRIFFWANVYGEKL